MQQSEALPSSGALDAVRRLAGSPGATLTVTRLEGGQHADTWRVHTDDRGLSVIVRQFPVADSAAAHEQFVLETLGGLEGLAPVLLGGDLDGRWSEHPTSLISRLDGRADITPADPEEWAAELARALAVVHGFRGSRLMSLPSIFDSTGSQSRLDGPLAGRVRSWWDHIIAAPNVLTHSDFWSGNVIWRDHRVAGIVDWSGAARGPRGYDLAWCRLDLVLLFNEQIADVFLRAYEAATGSILAETALWDSWAAARSHNIVQSWVPNYAPLGRVDLDATELLRLHSRWTARLLQEPTELRSREH